MNNFFSSSSFGMSVIVQNFSVINIEIQSLFIFLKIVSGLPSLVISISIGSFEIQISTSLTLHQTTKILSFHIFH
ncbi:MAG: hypothetical protein ACOZBL_04630 [Patescibacteria group bacterium]